MYEFIYVIKIYEKYKGFATAKVNEYFFLDEKLADKCYHKYLSYGGYDVYKNTYKVTQS